MKMYSTFFYVPADAGLTTSDVVEVSPFSSWAEGFFQKGWILAAERRQRRLQRTAPPPQLFSYAVVAKRNAKPQVFVEAPPKPPPMPKFRLPVDPWMALYKLVSRTIRRRQADERRALRYAEKMALKAERRVALLQLKREVPTVPTWAQARSEKRWLEAKLTSRGWLYPNQKLRLRILRAVAREKKYSHNELLASHKFTPHVHQRSDIPRGRVWNDGRGKSVKVRAVIPDSAPKWSDADFICSNNLYSKAADSQRSKERRLFVRRAIPRQARLGLVLDSLPQGATSCCAALVEGYIRAQILRFARKDPDYLDRLKEAFPGKQEELEPQMETAHGETGVVVNDSQGNVVLSDQQVESVSSGTVRTGLGFLPQSSAMESQTFSQITSRWLKYSKEIKWQTIAPKGSEILQLWLPYDVLVDNLSSPNVLPFLIHKYARLDMKVKVLVNSNKFQVGQLQVSWMYNSHINRDYKRYDNIYLASQRKFAILNAGSSNSAEIDIPYWNLYSAMMLKQNKDEMDMGAIAMKLGGLSIKVLSPLRVPDGNHFNAAFVSVYISFDNPEFRGLCDMNINSPFLVAQPNMEEVVNTMESVLHIVKPCLDMDKPSKPEVSVNVFPKASHGFSAVQGQNEVLTVLRADPLAQTPGLIPNEGEQASLGHLLSKWSLVSSFQWRSTNTEGNVLFKCDSAPMWQKDDYAFDNYGTQHRFYHLPIISVISSMFAYWRGDIELRFDFVATQFHSGRIMVATIPGAEGNETIDQAKNSANMVFSLTDSHQMVYRIPYYGNVPWWNVKHNLDRNRDVYPPSKTIVYVVNPLIPMESVVPDVEVLVYVRAASNFELALLKTPSLGLSFNLNIDYPTSSSAWVDPNWPQMFTSGSRQFLKHDGTQAMSFFDSETTDYFTEFLNLDYGKVYNVPTSRAPIKVRGEQKYFRCQYYDRQKQLLDVQFMVRAYSYPYYPVVLIFGDLNAAKNYIRTKQIDFGLTEYAQGPWAEISNDGRRWTTIDRNDLPAIPFTVVPTEELAYEFVEPNMEEARSTIVSSITLDKPAISVRSLTFGEQIDNLKQICRRWQFCGCGTYKQPKADEYSCLSQASPLVRINTHPIREYFVYGSSDRDNRLRDGAISIVASGFAGYRGSMRYRIVINGRNIENLSFAVVHKFDKRIASTNPTVDVGHIKTRQAQDWMDSAYALDIQSTFVNNVLEFEVPFYNKGEYNSLYRANGDNMYIIDNFQASGQVLLYASGLKANSILGFDVFYSVGDDFVFSNFQGFPSMTFLDEIPAEPNMDYIKSFFTMPKQLGDMCDAVKSSCGTLATTVVSTVSSVASTVKNIVTVPFVAKGIDSLSSLAAACSGAANLIITQILHILASPKCKATIAISIFSILCVTLSTKISTIFSSLKKAVSACWHYVTGENKPNTPDKTEATPNMDPEPDSASFVSLLWSIVVGIIGYVGRAPKNFKDFTCGLFKSSVEMFRSHIFGVKFFRDFFEMFRRMWGWINRKLGFQKPLYVLTQNDEFLKEWALSAAIVLAPENSENLIKSKEWVAKLFEVQIMGRLIKQAAINTSSHIKRELLNLILENQKALTAKVDELIKRKCFVPIRQEPFISWFVGDPGLGKSHISQEIMRKMAFDYKLDPSIFSLSAGQKYYDLLGDQKFVLLDDFLNWVGDSAQDTYAQYLQMSGSAMLSLPRAVASEKAVMDNFEFIFVTANQMWFDQITGIKTPEAYNRRRNMTIEMKLTDEYVKGFRSHSAAAQAYRKRTTEQKKDYKDILFKVYYDDNKEEFVNVKGFDDLYKIIKAHADRQRADAERKYFLAVKQHAKAVEAAAGEASTFKDFFEKMKKLDNCDLKAGMSEILQQDVKDSLEWLSERLKARYSIYESKQPSEKLKETVKKDLDEVSKVVTKAEVHEPPKASAPPEDLIEEAPIPNGPDDFDDVLSSVLKEAMLDDRDRKALRERFHPPMLDLYQTIDLPVFECSKPVQTNHMSLVFPGPQLKTTDGHYKCPHADITLANARYYRIKDTVKEEIRLTYNVPITPNGIFVEIMHGDTGESYFKACFDIPCQYTHGLDKACSWAKTHVQEFCLSRYWCSLLSSFEHLNLKWKDLAEKGDDMIQSVVPQILFKRIKNLYEREKVMIVKPSPGKIRSIIDTITFGFTASRVTIDGIDHAIYPCAAELQNGGRIDEEIEVQRSRGLLYDDVSYKKNGYITKTKELSAVTKTLITVGLVIVAIAYMCMFIDIIIWFLEFYGLISLFKPSANMSTSGDIKVTKQAAKATVKAVQLLMSSDNGLEKEIVDNVDAIKNKIVKNTFFIVALQTIDDKVVKRCKARCLGVVNQRAIVLTHYVEHFNWLCLKEPGWSFYLYRMDSKTLEPFELSSAKFTYPDGGGYCVMDLPPSAVQFRDIRKFMPHEGTASYPSRAVLIETDVDKIVETELDITLSFRKRFVKSTDGGMSDWTIDQMFEYEGKGGKGLCGSFLYAPKSPTPLIGIHTAGVGDKLGFSELLLRETFQNTTKVIEMVTPNLKVDETQYQPSGPHVSVGHVDKDMGVISQHTTRIIPSKAHGLFETRTEPAPLNIGDPRLPPGVSPLFVGVEKRCDPLKPFPQRDLECAVEDVKQMILVNCKPVRARVEPLSVAQAVEGVPNVRGMEPLELKTSEGYPWVKMRKHGMSSKQWMFDMDYTGPYPKCIGIYSKLQEMLLLKQNMRERGVVPATFFTACLKDARIAKEKCKIPGKTRIFEMSPVDLTIAQRQYYLDFYAAYMSNRRKCENTIGINVNGKEWSLLANDLTSHSLCILGGDYSSYGPRMSLQVLHAVWDIKNAWIAKYAHEKHDDIAYETIKYECLNSLLIVGRYVMRAISGMHSGNCATVILNSLCNSVLVRLAYLGIMREARPKYCSMVHFNKFVKMFSNGDDLIMAVDEDIIADFNNLSMSKYFAKFGLKYTNSKKDQDVVPYESIFDVSYLKCGFQPHPFRSSEWLAPLSKESIEDTPQWIWDKDADHWDATIQNCEQAVRLSYGWGENYFNFIRSRILAFLTDNGKRVVLPTWSELDALVWDEELVIVEF